MIFREYHNRFHKSLVLGEELLNAFNSMKALLITAGIDIEMICGWRGEAEQQAALDAGNSKAKFGQSAHNYGVAFDCVPIINGKPVWDVPDDLWLKIGMAGKKYGLEWGGDFKSILDRPHFQVPEWEKKHFELFYTEPTIG